MPSVEKAFLFPNQIRAVVNVERSLFQNRPRALVQMATGSGKTIMAITAAYRLIKFGGARRVLFLVDRTNLGEQAEKEFQGFRTPDDNRKFTELYNVQRLTSNTIGASSKVVITTIQRLYSMLKGEPDFDPEAARELAPTSVAWRATVVGECLRDAQRQGVVAMDVTAGYKPPKPTRGFAPRVLTSGELKKVLATPDRRSWTGKRDLAALVLMGIAGLRVGEVTRLRIGDIALKPDRVEIRVRGKGDRISLVARAGKNASPLRTWAATRGSLQSGAPFFIARRSESDPPRAMSVAQLDYVVRKHGRAAGIERLHAHLLRHTCASLAIANGANLVAIRDLLGHSSVSTTSKYLHAAGSAIV
jgi:integrase